MRLYSIRHKVSGKFLQSHHPVCGAYWSASPNFWKTPNGIQGPLMRLCCKAVGFDPDDRWPNLPAFCSKAYGVKYEKPDYSKLNDIEVIVTNVSVLGEESLPASDFIDFEEVR